MEVPEHLGLEFFRSTSEVEATHTVLHLVPVVYDVFSKAVATKIFYFQP